MDFTSPFEKFAYSNTYIYNLLDYFSRHIYPHPTFGADINNIIILFDHYLQTNLKPYAIYIDVGSYFTSHKWHIYFQKKDYSVFFIPLLSHKSVDIIEKSNNIIQ